ncbi:hypothetical protein EX895_005476 [Sporisorium graminicola]|uniref:Uncharacterized protein n=1 Tax=Sporisorium graminicola TaxID=280036 RepID=A0A4U7KMD2_9BASI|nr:hypothetical protein EX895_005476 [Sporisorium graminicola]TKY85314.1 hypothetical protein EX895_005476 [Sporisorium graminicola]
MVAALPVEIVDLILRQSLHNDQHYPARTSYLSKPLRKSESPIDVQQAATVSALSRRYRDVFQPHLYRHVTLSTARALQRFAHTIASRPELGTNVRSLLILCADDAEPSRTSTSGRETQTVADEILSACTGATHLLLSCDQFGELSRGLYKLCRPTDLTLVNVTQVDDLLGLITRHRDLTAVTLQNDPRIRAILASSSSTSITAASQLLDASSSSASVLTTEQAALAPRAEQHSLTHLHLVHFDARLLHRLVTLSSLTHVVLTHPHVPERRPGAPGLAVVPRSHLMLLLASGNVARVVVRADLPTCIRIMDEIAPIDDRKLVFRPIRSEGDGLAWQQQLQRMQGREESVARLGSEISALYDSMATSEVDLLAEFHARLVRPARGTASPASSAEEPDTSRGSSGRTGRSSDSSGPGTSTSGSGSGSGSTGSGEDDLAEPPGHSRQQQQQQHDDPSTDDESYGSQHSDNPPPPIPTTSATGATTAPPLNIPIEELLRSERFTPAGLPGPRPAASSHTSSGTGQTSSASHRTNPARRRGFTSRTRTTLTTTAFALRKTDLRGATQRNIDVCTALYDALLAEAAAAGGSGGGGAAAAHTQMGVW